MRMLSTSRSVSRLAVGCTIAATVIALYGCGGGNQAAQMTSFSTATAANQAEFFSLPANQMAHVQVVQVTRAPFERTLRLTGSVEYNAFKTTPVISQVGGPVSRMVVVPGQHVKAGDPMLYVASPDFSQLRSAYLKAKDALQLADRYYKRDQDLYTHHAIAEADLEQAESTRTQAQADLESSTDALRVLGVSNPDSLATRAPMPEVPVLAPVDGEVVERLCSPGQVLQSGSTQCFTISDMSDVWILANVYQNDLAYVHVGDPVTVQDESYPGDIRGKIAYVAPALDPTTRTLQARIDAPNPGERLKKEMYVTVLVNAGVVPNALSVPDSAILRDAQNMPYVYVPTGPTAAAGASAQLVQKQAGPPNGQFARQDVTVGDSRDGKTLITSGLQAGDRVVADGALFLQFQNSLQH